MGLLTKAFGAAAVMAAAQSLLPAPTPVEPVSAIINASPIEAVRLVNRGLGERERIHIWLGDPPIEWQNVHNTADYRKWLEQRDPFPAAIVRDEILANRRHALVLFGGGHLQRRQQATNYQMDHPLAQTVISLLEGVGVRTMVIINRSKQALMSNWPVPSLAVIRGTTVGAELLPQGSIPRVSVREDGSFAPIPRDQWIEIRQEDQFDAVLYLGETTPALPPIPRTICSDPKEIETRLQRIALTDLPAAVAERLRSLCGTP